jgi:hypothetical protein
MLMDLLIEMRGNLLDVDGFTYRDEGKPTSGYAFILEGKPFHVYDGVRIHCLHNCCSRGNPAYAILVKLKCYNTYR